MVQPGRSVFVVVQACTEGSDGRVPNPTTSMKLTARGGSAAVDGLNEARDLPDC